MNDNDSLFSDLLDDDGIVPGATGDQGLIVSLDQEPAEGLATEEDPESYDLLGIRADDEFYTSGEGEPNTEPTFQPTGKVDLIEQVLASKGINGTTIQYENENGELEEVDFYALPQDEQLAILNSNDIDPTGGLSEEELGVVAYLRDNQASLEEVIDYYKRQAVQEYIDGENIAGIEVNQYTDEELYALHLKAEYEDLTDDEIAVEIQKQLEHPDLFKKKTDKLRQEYKDIEVSQLEQSKLQEQQELDQRYEELENSLINVAKEVEDIGLLELDNEDKNEILSFLLDKDINGTSPFIKSLEDPKQLFEMAWYAKKGKDAFNILHDYYKKQIESVSRSAYAKGKAEGMPKVEQSTGKTFRKTDKQTLTPVTLTNTVFDPIKNLID